MHGAIKQKINNYLKDQPVLKAYLYGSYARGEQSDLSDIDILVDLDYSHPIGLEFIQIKLDLEDLLNKKVDLVTSKGLCSLIAQDVNKEKVLIYERKEGKAIIFDYSIS